MRPFGILFILLLTGLVGCATTKVERVGADTTTDLSGRWNDTDSRLVSDEMIKDVLSRPWLDRFSKEHGGKPPTVIVGTVTNRSSEHINVQTFTEDLQRALTNDGRVQFVASKSEREEVREERQDQQSQSSQETAKGLGKEIGSDYMLKGTINSILDEAGGTKAVYYQIDLQLFDVEKNLLVWSGQKKIKKIIEKSRLGF
ncbi:MAG TPA: penicillin-binding protein activator LpoB [Nitrospiria bacterium]|nr:penicillin-binding protein activator LpoB [Nitrospiria bacterium]